MGTALLGFVLSYVLQRLKERKEPRHRISWHATTEQGVIHAVPHLQADIGLSYKGSPVQDLTVVSCTVENTGNRVVKNHSVRFEFPAACVVLDAKLDPEPQRELAIERNQEQEAGNHEVVYKIGHLETGQLVSTRLLVSGRQAASWRIYSFNETGDVEFRQRDAARSTDDSAHVVPFFSYVTTMIVMAVILSPVAPSSDVVAYALAFLESALVVFLGPTILPVARLFREYLLARIHISTQDPSVVVYGGSVSAINVTHESPHAHHDKPTGVPGGLPGDTSR